MSNFGHRHKKTRYGRNSVLVEGLSECGGDISLGGIDFGCVPGSEIYQIEGLILVGSHEPNGACRSEEEAHLVEGFDAYEVSASVESEAIVCIGIANVDLNGPSAGISFKDGFYSLLDVCGEECFEESFLIAGVGLFFELGPPYHDDEQVLSWSDAVPAGNGAAHPGARLGGMFLPVVVVFGPGFGSGDFLSFEGFPPFLARFSRFGSLIDACADHHPPYKMNAGIEVFVHLSGGISAIGYETKMAIGQAFENQVDHPPGQLAPALIGPAPFFCLLLLQIDRYPHRNAQLVVPPANPQAEINKVQAP